jgi:hypothetical protein
MAGLSTETIVLRSNYLPWSRPARDHTIPSSDCDANYAPRPAGMCKIAAIQSGVTQLLIDTLEKRLEHINAVVDEVGLDNWGFAGKLS